MELVRGKPRVEPSGEVSDAGLVFHQLAEGDFQAEVFFEGIRSGCQEKGVETEVEERRGGIGGGGVDAGDVMELGAEFGDEVVAAGGGRRQGGTGLRPVWVVRRGFKGGSGLRLTGRSPGLPCVRYLKNKHPCRSSRSRTRGISRRMFRCLNSAHLIRSLYGYKIGFHTDRM